MGSFTIGVISRTVALINRHFVRFAVAAAILVFLPNFLSIASEGSTTRTVNAAGRVSAMSTTTMPLGNAGAIVVWAASLVFYGIVIRTALDDLRGERSDMAAALAASLRSFFSNAGVSILFYLALFVGSVLLIVPGIMLGCAWLVVIPINMAEAPSLFRTFGRSRTLTAGHRWRIFGLLVLYLVMFLVPLGVPVTGALLLGHGVDSVPVLILEVLSSIANSRVLEVVVSLLFAALALVSHCGTVACYIELVRTERGGLSPDLASAFD